MPKTIREIAVAYNKTAPLYDLMNRIYFFRRDKQFRSMKPLEDVLRPSISKA